MTDSTIAPPPKPAIFFNEKVSWLLDTRKGTIIIAKKVSTYFLVCKGLTIGDIGVSRDTLF